MTNTRPSPPTPSPSRERGLRPQLKALRSRPETRVERSAAPLSPWGEGLGVRGKAPSRVYLVFTGLDKNSAYADNTKNRGPCQGGAEMGNHAGKAPLARVAQPQAGRIQVPPQSTDRDVCCRLPLSECTACRRGDRKRCASHHGASARRCAARPWLRGHQIDPRGRRNRFDGHVAQAGRGRTRAQLRFVRPVPDCRGAFAQ